MDILYEEISVGDKVFEMLALTFSQYMDEPKNIESVVFNADSIVVPFIVDDTYEINERHLGLYYMDIAKDIVEYITETIVPIDFNTNPVRRGKKLIHEFMNIFEAEDFGIVKELLIVDLFNVNISDGFMEGKLEKYLDTNEINKIIKNKIINDLKTCGVVITDNTSYIELFITYKAYANYINNASIQDSEIEENNEFDNKTKLIKALHSNINTKGVCDVFEKRILIKRIIPLLIPGGICLTLNGLTLALSLNANFSTNLSLAIANLIISSSSIRHMINIIHKVYPAVRRHEMAHLLMTTPVQYSKRLDCNIMRSGFITCAENIISKQ